MHEDRRHAFFYLFLPLLLPCYLSCSVFLSFSSPLLSFFLSFLSSFSFLPLLFFFFFRFKRRSHVISHICTRVFPTLYTCIHFRTERRRWKERGGWRKIGDIREKEREGEEWKSRGDAQNRIYPRKRTASRRMAREKRLERMDERTVSLRFGSVVPRINQLCLSVFHRAGGELISFSLNTNSFFFFIFLFFEAKTYFD